MDKSLPLLGFNSSTKTAKGEKLNYKTGILYLKPASSVSIKTLCSHAKKSGCEDICLEDSGRLGMINGQLAMYRRTIAFLKDRKAFERQLINEIEKNATDKYAIRLNGTSDLDWSRVIEALPDIQFYDYSKNLKRCFLNTLPNYHLTYSGSFNGIRAIKDTKKALALRLNTALAFNTKECKGEFKIPETVLVGGEQRPIISFDDTDLRFLDPDHAIGSLTRKGSSREQRASELGSLNFFADLHSIKLLENTIL
jgi:hypothetical protein